MVDFGLWLIDGGCCTPSIWRDGVRYNFMLWGWLRQNPLDRSQYRYKRSCILSVGVRWLCSWRDRARFNWETSNSTINGGDTKWWGINRVGWFLLTILCAHHVNALYNDAVGRGNRWCGSIFHFGYTNILVWGSFSQTLISCHNWGCGVMK